MMLARVRDRYPSADAFIASLAKHGSVLGADVVRLGALLDRHDAEALERALVQALSKKARSAATVAFLLEQDRRARGRP